MTETLTMGERMRRLRRQKRWSQVELAAEAGVGRTAVARWETDAAAPQMTHLFDVARALGVSMDHLVGGTS